LALSYTLFLFLAHLSIGPHCDQIGLTKSSIKNFEVPDTTFLVLKRGVLYDLSKTYTNEELFSIINMIYPGRFLYQTICDYVKITKKTFTQLNKSRARNDKSTDYLNETIDFEFPGEHVHDIDTNTVATASGDPDIESEQSTSSSSSTYDLRLKIEELKDSLKSIKKEKTLLSDKLLNSQNEIESMNAQLELLKQSCLEMDRVKCDNASLISKAEMLTSQKTKMKNEIAELKIKLKDKREELAGLRSGNAFQTKSRAIRRKKQKLLERENKLKTSLPVPPTCVTKNFTLRYKNRQIKQLQTKVSDQKKSLNKSRENVRTHKNKLSEVTAELESTQAELLSLQSESINTKESNRYIENIEKCVMELCGELDVPSSKVAPVICSVSKWIYNKIIPLTDLPASSTVINIMDRAQVLSRHQVAEEILASQNWDLHGDGTSRDGHKIVGQQVRVEIGKTLSTGFNFVAVENSVTLLDNAIAMMEELCDIFDEEHREAKFLEMLNKMLATMSDRSSVNKAFNDKFQEYRKSKLGEGSPDLKFLFCNAHFLLGLSNSCESTLKSFEEEIVKSLGHGLGRDGTGRFARFSNDKQSASGRYVRTSCDVLGPRGDQKNGCRADWEAFCSDSLDHGSFVTSFRMNRFNNFFQGAAGLYFHQEHIQNFLSNYREKLNQKLLSVLYDCQSTEIQALIRALGIIYYVVTGPFWNLLQGDVEYVDQYKYIQDMLSKFKIWAADSSTLLNSTASIFPQYAVKIDLVGQQLFVETNEECALLTKSALEKIMAGFVEVTQRQLKDFLPGGDFGQEVSEELRETMKYCKLTNLLSEHEFGDLDFSQFRRRNASMHFHSTIQMVKRNKTISNWLSSKSPGEQSELLNKCRKKAVQLRKKHKEAELNITKQIREKLEEINRKKTESQAAKVELKRQIIERVTNQGGPCTSPSDVDNLLKRMKSKSESKQKEAIKDEIRYLKQVMGISDSRLVFGKKKLLELAADIKGVLSVNSDLPAVPMELPSVEMEPAPSVTSSKRKLDSENTNNIVSSSSTTTRNNFKFTRQGVWVAVAYEEDFFIGSVVDIKSPDLASIQFLSNIKVNKFKWPSVDELADVESKFIFAMDFDVTSANGRVWEVPEFKYVKTLYKQYEQMYFDFDDEFY
jgi:aubergine-like protein